MARNAHFTPELFRFLEQLRRNNRREWFEKHRDRYAEVVKEPMLRFIADVGPELRKISSQLVADPRPNGGSMFRIYRDTRFSKDKTPYKTHAAAQFRHKRGKDVHAPCLYLGLAPGEVHIGTGIWHPDGAALQKIRKRIADRPQAWRKATSGKPFRDGTLRLGGESLKRPPRGFDPEHPMVEDLKRKDFITMTSLDEDAACAPGFLLRFIRTGQAASPLLRFLTGALGLPF